MKTTNRDPHNYQEIIKKAFPNALVNTVNNFDDVHYGWMISPRPGELIKFMVDERDPLRLRIIKFSIIDWGAPQLHYSRLFDGQIPMHINNLCPDFLFIEQILKNFRAIGDIICVRNDN